MRNNKLTTTKVHYKSYKAGKRWVFAGIATVAMGLGLTGMDVTAHAADAQGSEATQTQVADSDTTISKSETLTTTTKKETTENSETPVTTSDKDKTPAPKPDKDETPAPVVTPDKDETPTPTVTPDKDETPAPVVTPDKDKTPAPVTTPEKTEMPKMSRMVAPAVAAVKTYDPAEIQGKDASEWMPDAGLRDIVESALLFNHNIKATDANLYQYVGEMLDLDDNNYTGSLKIQNFEGLQYFTNLNHVVLHYYPKDGFIDFDFAPNMTEFAYEGKANDAPSDFDAQNFMDTYLSGNQNLQFLVVHNLLKGNLPNLSSYTKLSRLDLSTNHLTGDLTPLKGLTSVNIMDVDHNQLTGELPDLVTGTQLTELFVQNNQLSGTLNPVYGSTSRLIDVWVGHNNMTGDLPSFKGFTGSFDGTYNHFSSGLNNMPGAINTWYQTLTGGTYNLTDDKNTFDPIKNVVSGIQNAQTGEFDPTDSLFLYAYGAGKVYYGEPDPSFTSEELISWLGSQQDVSSQFQRQATTDDPFGFNLIASKDVKPGTYTMGVVNDKYSNGGYIAFITFKITRDAETPVDPGTPVDPVQTGTITIVNVDQDGKTLSTKTLTGTAGDTYTATADTLDGYKLTSPASVTGTYTQSGSTITFTYAAVTNGGDGDKVVVTPDKPGKKTDNNKQTPTNKGGQAATVNAKTNGKVQSLGTSHAVQAQQQQLASPAKTTDETTLPQTNEHRTAAAWGLGLLGTVLSLGGLALRRKQN
ncbi:MucBP domain-containing protein [Levilactobacillus paucivorans]|nr:MucBP domain-containing protein [Levilactobacillus paucivorans]